MVDIHNNKFKIINSYARDYDAYMRVLNFMKTYITRMERLLGDLDIGRGSDRLPCVIFGSHVYLKGADTDERKICRVMLPREDINEADISEGITLITCDTPEAYELLLKSTGDSVELNENGIRKRFIIERIECHCAMAMQES